jgi:N-acetylmuramoyl-L-alanine amidase
MNVAGIMERYCQDRYRRRPVRLPAAICLFPALFLLLSGCAKRVYSPPPRQAPPPSSAPSARHNAPEVSEQCLVNLDTPRTIRHEVGPLETLWRISRMYDVPVETICAANGIKQKDPISIGQKLIIPNAKTLRHVVALYPNPCWKYIIVHHTATEIGNAILINRSHHDRGFWHGLGYHFLIDNGTLGKGDGQIEEAPRWIKQQTGAHCKAGGMNEKGIGIALVGNFNEDVPTPKQIDSLVYLLRRLGQYYKIDSRHILGHRDVDGASTDCPGKRFPWATVRRCL